MESKTLKAAIRTGRGKRVAKNIRKAGGIPAVVYGAEKPISVSVDEHEFTRNFRTVSENTIINLVMESGSVDVLVKDYQENILTGKINHIDFYQVMKDKLLRTKVPVRLEGTARGVRDGGILEHLLHDIDVECLPKDIPQHILLNVSDLAIGDSIHIGSIPAMEGGRNLHQPEQVIVLVAHAGKAEAEPAKEAAETAAATPEAEATETAKEE